MTMTALKLKPKEAAFLKLYDEANASGYAAAQAVTPEVMRVVNTQTGQVWVENEGMCGFAWVTVRPGNSPFANWLKKQKLGRTAYGGGVCIWISAHGQSVDRKTAHARAMSRVLEAAGIQATSGSRLD